MKQCSNKECNASIPDEGRYCFICGNEYVEPKAKRGFFGRKKQEEAQGEIPDAKEYPDFKLAVPEVFQHLGKQKENVILDSLQRIEQKIDAVISNNNWLLANVDNWLEGYRKAQEKAIETNK